MSHVATIELHVTDLVALKAAAKRLGLEFRENQKTYRWWGRSVGDYPLPDGFTADELGHCEHAIGVPGDDRAYEVGVVRRKDGKPGYTLLWDFYNGGQGLEKRVGANCQRLVQGYATEKAKAEARRMGYRVQEQAQKDGSIRLVLQR